MMIINICKKILNNKVINYLLTRYFTYFLQFVTSILIAKNLGPFYFGVWGFALLVINYFRIFDFGISNATNILLVQNRNDKEIERKTTTASILLISILGFFITILIFINYLFDFSIIEKYSLKQNFIWLCIIGIIANFNVLFMSIYRVNNSLKEIAIYQTIIPLLTFICVIFLKDKLLLTFLIGCYLIGNLYSLIIFIRNKKIPKFSKIDFFDIKNLLNKSIFLFLYNVSFYLIIVSVKSLISLYYSVEEFGFFSFAYSLANSILLFLQALSFVIFPKVIYKLKGKNYSDIVKLIDEIRDSYVTLSFGLIFLGIILFPIILYFLPEYKSTYKSICFCALTIVLYTNSFGYGSFLMAQNKEKLLAFLAFSSLTFNIILALFLIKICNVSYEIVIFSTVISYMLYTFLCTYFAKSIMNSNNIIDALKSTFRLGLFIPYLLNFILIYFDLYAFVWIPLVLFIILNIRKIKGIWNKVYSIYNNPNSINI